MRSAASNHYWIHTGDGNCFYCLTHALFKVRRRGADEEWTPACLRHARAHVEAAGEEFHVDMPAIPHYPYQSIPAPVVWIMDRFYRGETTEQEMRREIARRYPGSAGVDIATEIIHGAWAFRLREQACGEIERLKRLEREVVDVQCGYSTRIMVHLSGWRPKRDNG